MYAYKVFGGCLQSPVPFPELVTAEPMAEPDWSLAVVGDLGGAHRPARVGELEVQPGINVRLLRHQEGYRLAFDDTGEFDVAGGGSLIRWVPGKNYSPDIARFDIVGLVLSTALYAGGALCLHGSAVAIDGRAVAFVAPKRHGKSTLATALAAAGGSLLSDDLLPVELVADHPVARPGIHNVRLWKDSAAALDQGLSCRGYGPDRKGTYAMDPSRTVSVPVPLTSVYVLQPVREMSTKDPPVRRCLLQPSEAAVMLMAHNKIGRLISGRESAVALQRACAIASSVAVFSLQVSRDFSLLPAVVRQLISWHHNGA